ncbi:MAG: hypothetical protein H6729_15125 [Deltaproteobacteria bacterium]|nr:hypothetical protein [Deltaproteobacteria bacterium]
MSVDSVRSTFRDLTRDGDFSAADAESVFRAAGNSLSSSEGEAIANDVRGALAGTTVRVADDALDYVRAPLASLDAYERSQNTVRTTAPELDRLEAERMAPGVATTTFAGTPIPESVKAVVNTARANGAIAYDVRELEAPSWDESHRMHVTEGRWSPYPQAISATGSMAFGHTEITPEKLKADMETLDTYNQVSGFRRESYVDPRTGAAREFEVAEYEVKTGKGTGDIRTRYDEASHPDPFARGESGERWSSNFAVLSDGSVHALPASRRTRDQPNLILTNPSLARGERLLFNGHLEARGGVITQVGMSGRLHKLAEGGDAKFVDVVALLKAWGFETAPNLTLQFEGRWPAPPVDPNTHVIG